MEVCLCKEEEESRGKGRAGVFLYSKGPHLFVGPTSFSNHIGNHIHIDYSCNGIRLRSIELFFKIKYF